MDKLISSARNWFFLMVSISLLAIGSMEEPGRESQLRGFLDNLVHIESGLTRDPGILAEGIFRDHGLRNRCPLDEQGILASEMKVNTILITPSGGWYPRHAINDCRDGGDLCYYYASTLLSHSCPSPSLPNTTHNTLETLLDSLESTTLPLVSFDVHETMHAHALQLGQLGYGSKKENIEITLVLEVSSGRVISIVHPNTLRITIGNSWSDVISNEFLKVLSNTEDTIVDPGMSVHTFTYCSNGRWSEGRPIWDYLWAKHDEMLTWGSAMSNSMRSSELWLGLRRLSIDDAIVRVHEEVQKQRTRINVLGLELGRVSAFRGFLIGIGMLQMLLLSNLLLIARRCGETEYRKEFANSGFVLLSNHWLSRLIGFVLCVILPSFALWVIGDVLIEDLRWGYIVLLVFSLILNMVVFIRSMAIGRRIAL